MELYEHNQIAYQEADKMLKTHGRAAVIHPTGTGKSFIAFKLIEEHPDAHGCPRMIISLKASGGMSAAISTMSFI